MASLGAVFDTDNLPKGDDFSLIPDGWYQAKILKADVKPTKDETGTYINMQYKIIGPTHEGRIVFSMINIRNKNPEAEQIGLKQFGELLRSIGVKKCSDTDVLLGFDLEIKVKTDKAKDGYDARNSVAATKSITGSDLPAVSTSNPFASKKDW